MREILWSVQMGPGIFEDQRGSIMSKKLAVWPMGYALGDTPGDTRGDTSQDTPGDSPGDPHGEPPGDTPGDSPGPNFPDIGVLEKKCGPGRKMVHSELERPFWLFDLAMDRGSVPRSFFLSH